MKKKIDDFQTIRIWSRSHKRLRKIAAETGESIVQVLDRLSEQEWSRVQQMEQSTVAEAAQKNTESTIR